MMEIQLTKGKVALVDDSDFEYLNQYKWIIKVNRGAFYARRKLKRDGKQFSLDMHREIMNAQPGEIIDHRDGNGLNNQRSNLRRCSYSQNNANRKSRTGASSRYLGVSKYKNRWAAQIRKDKALYKLGRFKSEEDAALAYNEAAIKFHGEFARLNVLPDSDISITNLFNNGKG